MDQNKQPEAPGLGHEVPTTGATLLPVTVEAGRVWTGLESVHSRW